MFIEGLTDWEKRRLAIVLKERGYVAFMVIKHASAAILSQQRDRIVHDVDARYLALLDDLVYELYGYSRTKGNLRYHTPEENQFDADLG